MPLDDERNGKIKLELNGSERRKRRPSPPSPEAVLRSAIAQLGLERTRQIMAEVEATFAGG